jgi:hypothetical protein
LSQGNSSDSKKNIDSYGNKVVPTMAWGGSKKMENSQNASLSLSNTCPLDTGLTLLDAILSSNGNVFGFFKESRSPSARTLIYLHDYVLRRQRWVEAKLEWLKLLPEYSQRIKQPGTIDLFGSIYERFLKAFEDDHEILHVRTIISKSCSSIYCPRPVKQAEFDYLDISLRYGLTLHDYSIR